MSLLLSTSKTLLSSKSSHNSRCQIIWLSFSSVGCVCWCWSVSPLSVYLSVWISFYLSIYSIYLSVGRLCVLVLVGVSIVCLFVRLVWFFSWLSVHLSICLSVDCVSWCWSVSPSPGSLSYRTCRSCSTTSRPSPRSWRRPSALSTSWRCSGNGPTSR